MSSHAVERGAAMDGCFFGCDGGVSQPQRTLCCLPWLALLFLPACLLSSVLLPLAFRSNPARGDLVMDVSRIEADAYRGVRDPADMISPQLVLVSGFGRAFSFS